ncbi:hypothetical protein Ppa06_23890 [Planomonospora parontospora subsp. parontospora]|uniref:DUF4386 family protein n=2 Tax=Planomonospora parontospora TaxID=58119 RepID=A0AA37BGB2_9ACTN|nr:DUF4386 family protein [Planomonospora parontospora]GGK67146.1 hypothetical protein GCM10010126_28300 [Planomonospora parontospora]GII08591.1 hypothetical protein Ppa06_23890 [Planomonospora parontospora subsp. parontospora]
MNSTTRAPATVSRTPHTRTAILLIVGAVVVNTAFALLGTAFDYPDVLQYPVEEVLRRFHADRARITGLFLLLATGAALLAPIAVRAARLAGAGLLPRTSAAVGVAAAAVQVVGLLRWPLLVPPLAVTLADPGATAADRAAAVDRFHTLHTVLGQIVGEAFGYLLTAAWTVLIVVALRRGGAGHPVPHRFVLGRFSAGLALLSVPPILAGLLVPLGAPGADLANFIGYVAWSLWLVVFGAGLLRDSRRQARMVTDRGDCGHIA